MTFTVTWSEWAERHLAAIWPASSNRNGVTRACHEIDRTHATYADTVGRKHTGNIRRYRHLPLAVEFEVNVADRPVTVIAAWEIAASTPGGFRQPHCHLTAKSTTTSTNSPTLTTALT